MKLVLILAALSLTGCATLFDSGPDHVMIDTEPKGVKVSLDNEFQCLTPCQVRLGRHSDGILTFDKEGYQPLRIDLDKSINGWFIVDLVLFPIGWLFIPVEIVTSNQGKYSQTTLFFDIPKEPTSTPLAPKSGL